MKGLADLDTLTFRILPSTAVCHEFQRKAALQFMSPEDRLVADTAHKLQRRREPVESIVWYWNYVSCAAK